MKSFIKNKVIIIIITTLLVFLIGNIVSYSYSHQYIINVNYDKSLIVKDVIIDYKDVNFHDTKKILDVSNIESVPGKTIVKFKAINSGINNIMVKCLFEDNQVSQYSSVSKYVRVNSLKMIFQGEKFTDLVSFEYLYYSFIFLCGILSIYTFIYFKNELKNNKFSYSCIFYCSAFFFFIGVFLVYVLSILYIIPNYQEVNAKLLFLITSNMMSFYVLATIPFVLIFAILLSISNIKLMKKEGKRPINALGIVFSSLVIFGIITVIGLFYFSRINYTENIALSIIYSIVSSFYVLFESILVSTIICGLYVTKKEPIMDKDYIIILGCKLKKNGELTPLLKGRVDRAIEFYNKQYELTGKKLTFIPSGGQGKDEIIAEGLAMEKYLLSRGIDQKQIIPEVNSTNTFQNMQFSRQIIEKENNTAKIIFSTTNYHLFRSGLIATDMNFKIEGIGSKTKWYFWPNAFIREIVGVFVNQKKKQIIILLLLAVLAGLSTYLYTLL